MPSFVSTLPIPSSTKHETKRFLIPIYIILAPAFRLRQPPPSGIKQQRSPSRNNLLLRHPSRLRHLPGGQCPAGIRLCLHQHGRWAGGGGRCGAVLPLPVGGVHAHGGAPGRERAGDTGVRRHEVRAGLLRQVCPGAVQFAARLHTAGEGTSEIIIFYKSSCHLRSTFAPIAVELERTWYDPGTNLVRRW